MFYVGHREDFGPMYFIVLLPLTPKYGNPKQSSYMLTVNYLNLKCLHVCTISEGKLTLLLYWNRRKNI